MGGVNADPRQPAYVVSPETVRAAGYDAVRSVITPDHDMRLWAQDCAGAGIDLLPVVARETFTNWSEAWTLSEYMAEAEALRLLYGDLFRQIQVGNEPDLVSESSWSLTPEQVNVMLEAFRMVWVGATIVGPGLANGGNPDYADRLDPSLYDVLAIHAYGFMPDNWPLGPYSYWIRYLVQQYQHIPKPIWVTEYGGKRGELPDEATRGAYYRALERDLLNHPKVDRAYAFCLDTMMHDQYGVRDYGNEIPGWDQHTTDLYPIGGLMQGAGQPHPLMGNPWGGIGLLTVQTMEGQQMTFEFYEYGLRCAGPDGSPYNLPHVEVDAGDPNILWVAGKPFRFIG